MSTNSVSLKNGCFPYLLEGNSNGYGYWPTLGAGIAFDVLFIVVLVGHLVQFVRLRKATSILFAIGAASTYPCFVYYQ
jgi:hypothetical protein